MTEWRYIVSYSGTVEADGESHAIDKALDEVYASVHGDRWQPIPLVEVKEGEE